MNQIMKNEITKELYTRFINYIDASKKTIETYTKALRQFANWLINNRISQPTREDIITFREYLKSKYKPTTVQMYITVVRLFFSWTSLEQLYPNIAEHVKGVKLDKGYKKDYLTANQVKLVMQSFDRSTIQGKRDYAMFVLMVTCGLRTIEVSRANVGDIKTVGGNYVLFIQGKGHDEKDNFVKLSKEVKKAIQEYLKARESECEINTKKPLFASLSNNSKGQRLSTRSISGIIKLAFKESGLDSDRLTAHSTRHTAITLALLAGQTLQEVQQFARHISIATTQIYAHNLDRLKNKCETVISKAIFPFKKKGFSFC